MRNIALTIVAVSISLLSIWLPTVTTAGGAEQQVCDVGADYPLGVEDYLEAIRLHIEVVRKQPANALAHYHLGFALGMLGDRLAEVREYRQAETLGLTSWDLFLNLGLALIDSGDLDAATENLRRAVVFGGDHFESHFNLALVDERRGMLADAEHETLEALRLNPEQPDARSLLGAVYAQEGDTASAFLVWSELVRDVPDYEAARKNLANMGNRTRL